MKCIATNEHCPNLLISCSDDKTVRLSDIEKFQSTRSKCEIIKFSGHSKSVNKCGYLHNTPNYILSASEDSTCILWDSRSVMIFFFGFQGL